MAGAELWYLALRFSFNIWFLKEACVVAIVVSKSLDDEIMPRFGYMDREIITLIREGPQGLQPDRSLYYDPLFDSW